MSAGARLPEGVHRVREPRRARAGVPLYPVPDWTAAFPWLAHGTTGSAASAEVGAAVAEDGSAVAEDGSAVADGAEGVGPAGAGADTDGGGSGDPADLGLFGPAPAGAVLDRWRRLREALGVPRAVHSQQIHEAGVLEHMERLPGLSISHGYDGHVTGYPGILLTVSLADCVPIFLVDAELQRIGLLHGGWRGTAAGIVEAGVEAMGGTPGRLYAHLGPAVCGECYEVGPEVHQALGLEPPPSSTPVDLRAVQARRLVEAGVAPGRVTVSEHCTLHDPGFFSHRGGSRGRQIGVLGVRN